MSDERAERSPIGEMRATYRDRDAAMPWLDHRRNMYHPRHPVGRLFRRHNQDVLQDALNRLDVNLSSLRILDVGSGFGHWLRHLVELGADPSCLTGVELAEDRLRYAARANPALNWLSADGAALPCRDAAFDLLFQVVTLSSVLDGRVQSGLCKEMARVVRPGGYIFWIDRVRPDRDRLAGFTRRDVEALFPNFRIRFSRSVHPLHFRWLKGRLGWLSELVFAIAPIACESAFFVLQRDPRAGRSA